MPGGLAAAATVVSGVSSSRAASKSAKAGRDAAERSAGAIQKAGDVARVDVLDLFPDSERQLLGGSSRAFDIFSGGLGAQQQALSQGNLNAQQTVGGGFNQVQAALLGLPVNTQNFAPRGVDFTQTPQNPFLDQGGGLIGAAPAAFETGQGMVAGRTGEGIAGTQPLFLNPISRSFDEQGGLIRNPDGSTNIDFGFSEDPNSAELMSNRGAAFGVAKRDQRRRFSRQDANASAVQQGLMDAIGILGGRQ